MITPEQVQYINSQFIFNGLEGLVLLCSTMIGLMSIAGIFEKGSKLNRLGYIIIFVICFGFFSERFEERFEH